MGDAWPNSSERMQPGEWQKVKAIFDSALEVEESDRAEYVAEACGEDESLRERVGEMLAAYQTDFLNASGYSDRPERDETGRIIPKGGRIARFEVSKLLGSGGMGQVYLARDDILKRAVAIKVFSREAAGRDAQLDRFLREAQSASALNHPHICTIYEINKDHDPPFIAMEYVEGRTLAEQLDTGRLEVAEAVDIALQIADGLAEAHEAGIVHRDIKPANIIVNKRGQVKIVDFGLAKKFVASAEDQTQKNITHSGTIIGTVSYMSPEQARGRSVDARTDIWSLGVVLCQMVTGRLPFAGETMSDTIASIIRSEPDILPDAMPPKMLAIARKALSKEKSDRYESIRHFAADLEKLTNTAPAGRSDQNDGTTIQLNVPTHNIATEIRDEGSLGLGRYGAAAGTFAAVALALVLWYIVSTTGGPAPIESVAVMPFTNATGDSGSDYLSDGLTESLIGRLSQLPKLSVKARSSVFRYKGKDVPLRQVGSELEVQGIIIGRFLRNAEQVTLYIELIDAATENVIWTRTYDRPAAGLATLQGEVARDVVENLRQKLTGAEEQKLARTYTENAQAYQLYLKGRFYWDKRNEDAYKVAVDSYNQAIALDPNYAPAYVGLADCYLFREMGLGREVAMPKAKEYALKALELDESLAEAHTTLAFVNANYDLDFPAGEREFKRAIELNGGYAIAHQFYGAFLCATGRIEQGLAEIRKAVELEPYTAAINWSLGMGLGFARRYDESIAQLQKTLQLQPDYALAEGSLAGMLIQTGRYDDAMALVEKHVAMPERRNGGLSNLAIIYAKTGRKRDAQKTLDQLLAENKNQNNPYNLARLYVALGEDDKAVEWLNKAVERRSFSVWFMRVDPFLESLHDNSQFQQLLRRIGLQDS